VSSDKVISAASKQYILVAIEGRDDNGVLDPTSLPVEMAFLPQDTTPDEDTTWHTGSWVTVIQSNLPNIYKGRVLIGPDGGVVTLTPGSWDVWVKVTHAVEEPVVKADTILVV